MLKKTVLIAAAFATVLAVAPAKVDAGSKTGHFIGGVAAGIGGVLLYKAIKKNQRRNSYYAAPARRKHVPVYEPAPRYRYYQPAPRYYDRAPRYRQYRPVNNCRSTRSVLRKLGRRGFHSFHNIRYRSYSTKLKAWKYGEHYKIKLNRCSGRIIWTQVI